jgi:hypothetical protein
MSTLALNARILGQAESAHRALLERLIGTHLTEAGRSLHTNIRGTVDKIITDLYRDTSPRDLETLGASSPISLTARTRRFRNVRAS